MEKNDDGTFYIKEVAKLLGIDTTEKEAKSKKTEKKGFSSKNEAADVFFRLKFMMLE